MPEQHFHSEKKTAGKHDFKGCKARLLFDQRMEVLTKRILLLEKENSAYAGLIENEKQLNFKKSQFLSSASHDCRSPLTSIQLSASLIERYYDRLDRQRLFAHLDKIKFAVTELTDKLDELIAE